MHVQPAGIASGLARRAGSGLAKIS